MEATEHTMKNLKHSIKHIEHTFKNNNHTIKHTKHTKNIRSIFDSRAFNSRVLLPFFAHLSVSLGGKKIFLKPSKSGKKKQKNSGKSRKSLKKPGKNLEKS